MTIDHDVPFVANTDDDLHCYSASLAMILGYFVPDATVGIDVGTRISEKPDDKAVWPLHAPLWLQRHGFDVSVVFDFDYRAVADTGLDYVRGRYGDEVADYQAEHSVVPTADVVNAFLDEVSFEKRIPELEEVTNALDGGALVAVTVNSSLLKGEEGYMNHSVVVKGYTAEGVILHNPGLPPEPQQHVGFDDFVAAWSHPSADARYLMTVGTAPERRINADAVRSLAAPFMD